MFTSSQNIIFKRAFREFQKFSKNFQMFFTNFQIFFTKFRSFHECACLDYNSIIGVSFIYAHTIDLMAYSVNLNILP